MNSKGVTLVEVIIFAVLLVIVSAIIGSQVKTMLRNYSGTRRVLTIQGDSRDVLSMLSREIKNTGFRKILTGAGPYALTEVPGVTFADGSSINPSEGTPGDRLNIRKANVDANGNLQVPNVEDITYSLNGTNLRRSSGGIDIDLAQNVYALQFNYGVLSQNQLLINQDPIVEANWSGTNCNVDPFGGTMVISVDGAANARATSNTPVNVSAGYVKIAFQVSGQNGFPANLINVKWVLRGGGGAGGVLGSEEFLARSGRNEFEFPVKSDVDARLSLEFTSTGAGRLVVTDVVLRKVSADSYNWVHLPTAAEMSRVKAIRIYLLTRTSEKTETKRTGNIQVANYSAPASGNYTWRLYQEVVEIPNNGN